MINFGDVFRFKEEMYVYLVQAGELTFAARILDRALTQQLIASRDKNAKNPHRRSEEKLMYCFAVLTTDDFREQAAHYGKPEMPTDATPEPVRRLCEADIEKLKIEIMNDGATNILLRDTIIKLFPKKGKK